MNDDVVRIAIVAGEASGDQLGSHLISALKARLPNAIFYGIGGAKMIARGLDDWFPQEKLAVRGLVEVLRHLREILALRRALKRRLLAEPPDIFIGIDAPDFNLPLEGFLKRHKIPCVHYVSPSIWAWRKKRINKIGRAVSKMLVLFPFEPKIYEEKKIPVTYVGHPLADMLPLEDQRTHARELLRLAPSRPIFTLLPGSCKIELDYMGDLFIQTAREIHRRLPEAQFLVPLVTRETRTLFEHALYRLEAVDLPIRLLFGHAHEALMAADVALVASGTATLEAALLKRAMVITYKGHPLSFKIARRLYRLPYVGLPNILARKFVVPELLQDDATPENLAQAVLNLYVDKTTRDALVNIFYNLHLELKQNTAERAATAILDLLPKARTNHVIDTPVAN